MRWTFSVSASLHSESFGLAIVEAMAAGTAVVATETDGAGEIRTNGSTGILVPIGGIERMAETINELLLNQEQRSTLATNARRDAERRDSVSIGWCRNRELYAEVLA